MPAPRSDGLREEHKEFGGQRELLPLRALALSEYQRRCLQFAVSPFVEAVTETLLCQRVFWDCFFRVAGRIHQWRPSVKAEIVRCDAVQPIGPKLQSK